MTTIEVAKTAGVSQATVSRVINRYPGVSPDVVRAVRDAMKSVGYVPRKRRSRESAERGLNKTRNVLVVMLDESCMRRPTLSVAKQRGVSEALAEAGMNMVLVHCVGCDRLPPVIEEGRFDGALLWGHGAPRAVLERLENKPVIWLSSHSDVHHHDCVLPGNESIGRLAANYLIERGHRRLAYLSTSTTHPGLRARKEAFIAIAQLARRQVHVLEDDVNVYRVYERMNFQQVEDSGMRFVQRLLELDPRPTGIFSPDDALTSVVHRGLAAAGVPLGQEVALVSCNNETPYLANLHPRPATIDLGPEVTGRRAVEQLLWRIRHGTESRRVQVIVEPVLVPGELDGPANVIPRARV